MKRLIATAFTVLVLAGCSTGHDSNPTEPTNPPWPTVMQQGFMEGCGYTDECRCILDKFQQVYTVEEAAVIVDEYNKTGQYPPKFLKIAINCQGAGS